VLGSAWLHHTAECYNVKRIQRKGRCTLTIVLHLPADIEDRLHAAAAAKGLAPQEFAAAAVTDAVLHVIAPAEIPTDDFDDGDDDYEPTPEDKARAAAFIAWAESHKGQNLPDIPMEMLRRRNMYDKPRL